MAGWRQFLLPAVAILYLLTLAAVIPICILYVIEKKAEKHVIAWFVAGLFVLLTIPISLYDILQHVVHYTQPDLQRYYIR